MTDALIFHVLGDPVAKLRPRVTTKGGFARTYTPKATRDYEATVAARCREVMEGRPKFDGPLHVTLRFVMPIPASWSAWKRDAALVCDVLPTGTPDLDNLEKSVKDGMNGIVYGDDSQIVCQQAEMRYGQTPMVVVMVEAIRAAPSSITTKKKFLEAICHQ